MATTPNFLNPAIFADVSTPPTPESGYMKLYSKTGVLTVLNSGGVESSLNLSAYLPLAGGTLTQPVSTSGSPTAFTLTGAAHTTLTASTEATDVNFNLARTVQFATGALTTQRAMRIQAPTYSFVAASTITTASTLSISGPPVAGTNATITSAYALNVESGNANFAGSLSVVGTAYATTYSFMNQNLQISAAAAPYTMLFITGGGNICQISMTGTTLCVGSGGSIGFASGGLGATTTTGDTLLFRDAAGTLAQRNGVNAQTFRVYNTYTSATSYETFVIDWQTTANTIRIGSEKGSAGGTGRDVQFVHGSDSLVWGGYGAASWAGIGQHTPGYRASWVGTGGSTGFYATALGFYATAPADFSTAIGAFSYARYPGRTSLSAGQGPVHAQSRQSGVQTLTAITTDATNTILGTPTSGPVTHTACSLVSNSSITIRGLVTAKKSDNSETASFEVFASWQNNAGTLTMVGSTITQLSNNLDAWALVASADNTNKRWVLTATGVAATTVMWDGTFIVSEIT